MELLGKYKRLDILLAIFSIHFIIIRCSRTLKDFPEECFTASEIDDDTRAFENHDVPTSKADDLDMKKGWYRIMGKTTNSLKQGFDKTVGNIANAPNFCGTVYAGTLMGEHPTVKEGMTEMTVCFRRRFCFYNNIDACECKSKKTIFVRNCQNHYIYWLSPTNRQERYCTGLTSLKGAVVTKAGISKAIECTQYKTLADSRLWSVVSDVKCDKQNGWYRFSGDSGKELASRCEVNSEPISRLAQPCGAAFRGWMVDRHPTLAQGRRNTRVCFSYPDSCSCEFFTNLVVRNCGEFFVYQLHSPPLCNARYCGAASGSSVVINDFRKPPLRKQKDICNTKYQVLHDPSRLWSYTSPTESNCDARLYGYYRFGSKFTPWSIKQGCDKTDMNTVTHRCGTEYQGYMEDRPPTVNEGYVERIVCFQQANVPCECQFSTVIGVQNCSGFYIYELRGVPQCQSRLCMVANGSETMKIDVDRPPIYDIPEPGYVIPVVPSAKPKEEDETGLTTTVLCIIILIVLILIVIIILTVLYVAHPVLWPRKKQKKVEKLESGLEPENNPTNRLLVEECLPGEKGDDDDDVESHQYTAVPDAPPDEQEEDIIKRPDSAEIEPDIRVVDENTAV